LAQDTPPLPIPPGIDQRALALAVTDGFVVPAYRALAEAADANAKAWDDFVKAREAGKIKALHDAYNTLCDAWARAQVIKTGPVTLFLRYDRFAYWPEARNATQRALDALLMAHDPKTLAADALEHDNVAGQGLTALERLLYGDDAEMALLVAGEEGAWRVQVGLGIARNLETIADQVLQAWTAPDGVRDSIAADKGWNSMFADAAEAAHLLITDLAGVFKLMHDVKLLPVLGASLDEARPRVSEAWRSGRATRDLVLNLEASHAMEQIFAMPIPADHRMQLEALFAKADAAVKALPPDLGEAAADPARRPAVETARTAIKDLQNGITQILPPDLGLTVGFNSLDGD
jgi:predicted lipoprotein